MLRYLVFCIKVPQIKQEERLNYEDGKTYQHHCQDAFDHTAKRMKQLLFSASHSTGHAEWTEITPTQANSVFSCSDQTLAIKKLKTERQ